MFAADEIETWTLVFEIHWEQKRKIKINMNFLCSWNGTVESVLLFRFSYQCPFNVNLYVFEEKRKKKILRFRVSTARRRTKSCSNTALILRRRKNIKIIIIIINRISSDARRLGANCVYRWSAPQNQWAAFTARGDEKSWFILKLIQHSNKL